MEISPQAVSSATFRITKKGYDPDEVRTFLGEVARALENSQNHATAMEARARAAVAKSQEMRAAAPAPGTVVQPDDAETISKTLLLAQRTADATLAEAKAEAESLVLSARSEADGIVTEARDRATRTVEDARIEARRASEGERLEGENQVRALRARIDFLRADVAALERHARLHRERLAAAAEELKRIAEQPEGLAELARPALSAAATAESSAPGQVAAPAPVPSPTPSTPAPAAAPVASPSVPHASATISAEDTDVLPIVDVTDDEDDSTSGVGGATDGSGLGVSAVSETTVEAAAGEWRPDTPAPWMQELAAERSRTADRGGSDHGTAELPFDVDDDLPPPALRDVTPSDPMAPVASMDPTPPVIEVTEDATQELPRYRSSGPSPLRIIDDEETR